nr:MAG: hypothetical protein DIU70_05525 [Bacillota bacterium]
MGGWKVFAAYTPIDRCIGREVTVRAGGEEYEGVLAGIYQVGGIPVLVLVPMDGSVEHHVPLVGAVVTIRQPA